MADSTRSALLVEPDEEYAALSTVLLRRDGWDVAHVPEPLEALRRALLDGGVTLALVDASLSLAHDPAAGAESGSGEASSEPAGSAVPLLKRIREATTTLLIALSHAEAGPDVVQRVLEYADYELVKPFSPRRFRAAVHAVLRRGRAAARPGQIPAELRVGDLAISAGRLQVAVGDRTVELSPREFSLLHVLLANAGSVFTREELARTAWGWRSSVESRAVDNAIRRLRQKIEPDPAQPRYVLTERGTGYRLVAVDPDAAAAN